MKGKGDDEKTKSWLLFGIARGAFHTRAGHAGHHLVCSLCVWQNGVTPLYVASQEGHLPVVQHLLESKANVDQADEVLGGASWREVFIIFHMVYACLF